ncbi:MAG: lasso peptide biosynthesis B2 protein [Acidobacteriaceae bacterium]|jgi:hypothetical protein
MTLLGKMVRRKPADLLLAAEALALLAIFRVCLAVVPVRRIIGAITHGQLAQASDDAEVAESSASAARRVQWAVSAVARHSVLEFVCFPQALAGYTMLRWRGVPGAIVYGVARSPEGELLAHTWLTVGDTIVLGGEASGEFTAIERWT